MDSSIFTPLQRYDHDIAQNGFQSDAAQRHAIGLLQELYDRLLVSEQPSLWRQFSRWVTPPAVVPEQGLYFWGGVGRGKTYLMDVFFDALPFERKMRVHFHRFMRRVHHELTDLEGQKNPLQLVADRLAAETRIICFDEFFVSDITDAMILATLLEALFARGVALVATSNIVPDGLYRNGLQRARFLPAIALLNKHTKVVNVDGGIDYRLRALAQAELYHSPLGADAEAAMSKSFEALVPDREEIEANVDLEVEGRLMHARFEAEDVVWFDFEALCDGPRSQNDYIELARIYHAVLVTDVPVLGGNKDDQARRFVNMVDEFYDRSVKLVISAEVPLTELYRGGRLAFEFERTSSRLLEMQSQEYLARPHKP